LGLAVTLAIVVAAFTAYSVFFLHLIKVPTGAMQNTILPGDRIAATRMVGEIKRGDIIIFKFPVDTRVQYVKRVIGLPGEQIEFRDRKVYIDGNELPEKRVSVKPQLADESKPLKEISTEGEGSYRVFYQREDDDLTTDAVPPVPFGGGSPYQIPDRHYFVLGDNRDNSEDSRYWGTVPRDLVTGKAVFIYFSEEQNGFGEQGGIRWRRMFSRLK
jgi:signal peptidase I